MVVLNAFSFRFTIYKVHKASKKKREKSSAKKERKATKTLAIVLGKHRAVCVAIFISTFLLIPFFSTAPSHYLPLFQFQFSHFKVTKKIGFGVGLVDCRFSPFLFLLRRRHNDLCAESCTIHG